MCHSQIRVPILVLALTVGLPALERAQTPVPPSFTVGRNLQASGSIGFGGPAPEGGIEITISSEEPDRVLFSTHIAKAGSPSIVLRCPAGMRESPEFWVHALDDNGAVDYSVTSTHFGTLNGVVNLTPSAVVIMGPYRAPLFRTTPRGGSSPLALFAVRLDAGRRVEEQQAVAGGIRLELELTSSDPAVGVVNPAELVLEGGAGVAAAEFAPAGVGRTTLSVSVPPGFSKVAENPEITAEVNLPGISLTQDLTIGENLQVVGLVGLGEPAPPGGVTITLTSSDPGLLLLSRSETEVGSRVLEVTIPEGKVSAPVCLQSLAKTGSVSYTASADGHIPRTATISFAPSGVVVMFKHYGPPDEAELLRPHAGSVTGGVSASLSRGDKLPICVWTVQLDPTTLRGADITVQPLRAGAKLQVALRLSDPSVGKVQSPVLIAAGQELARTEFTPTAVGSTVISVVTPAGFTKAANSTSVTATIIQ